jgi:Tfp pilus assembly protein PilF
MFLSSSETAARGPFFYRPQLLFAALLLLLPLTGASAQGVGAGRELGGSGGAHIIQGRLHFPVRPTEGTRIRVRLEEPNVGTLSTVTDQDFGFKFSGLASGYYTLIIDAGKDYDVYREVVALDRETSRSPRVITVPVYLRPKGSSTAAGNASAAMADAPKAAVDFYTKAMESANKGDNKKAAELLSKAVEIHPKFALALSELGVQYLKLAQPEKAAEALQAALKIAPDEFMPRLNYGIALLNQKKFSEAEEQLRLALKKNDKAPTAHMYLGIVMISQKNLDEAEKELLLALSSNSSEVNLAHRYLGGVYWGKGDFKRAADELETYLKLVPKAPDAERTRAAIKELRSKQ